MVSSILIICGVTLIGIFDKTIPAMTGVTGMANTTAYATFNNVYAAFSLSSLIPILIIAAVIIALIVGAFSLFRASGAAE